MLAKFLDWSELIGEIVAVAAVEPLALIGMDARSGKAGAPSAFAAEMTKCIGFA